MYKWEEKGNVVVVKLTSYNGDIVEHSIVKEKGCMLRIGGTASNQITIKDIYVFGTYCKENDEHLYCCCSIIGTFDSVAYEFPVCGTLHDRRSAFLIETLDLYEEVRWLAMPKVPDEVRCHFINFDIIDSKGVRLRRLRLDPFMGGGRIL